MLDRGNLEPGLAVNLQLADLAFRALCSLTGFKRVTIKVLHSSTDLWNLSAPTIVDVTLSLRSMRYSSVRRAVEPKLGLGRFVDGDKYRGLEFLPSECVNTERDRCFHLFLLDLTRAYEPRPKKDDLRRGLPSIIYSFRRHGLYLFKFILNR